MRSLVLGLAMAGGIVALLGTSAAVFADANQPQKGQARVVERRGPELDLRQSAQTQVVVLFPDAVQHQGRNDVEIVLVESQLPPQSSDGQGQPQQAQSTGREILFSSRDADRGLVTHNLDASGNGRKLMLLARVDGQMVEVRQAGNAEGASFYTVQRPQQQVAQTDANAAQPADGQVQQMRPQLQSQGDHPQGQQNPQDSANQPQAQVDQSQTHQLQQQAHPEQAAIIIIYSAGGQ